MPVDLPVPLSLTPSSNLGLSTNVSNAAAITPGRVQWSGDRLLPMFEVGLSSGATRMFHCTRRSTRCQQAAPRSPATVAQPATPGYFKFDTTTNKVVTLRIATSLISVDQAKHNLELEISDADTFDNREGARTAGLGTRSSR